MPAPASLRDRSRTLGLKLAQMGRIAPIGDQGSTLLCVLVNLDIARREAGKGNYTFLCSEPSHMDIRQDPFVFSEVDIMDTDEPESGDETDPWDETWPP